MYWSGGEVVSRHAGITQTGKKLDIVYCIFIASIHKNKHILLVATSFLFSEFSLIVTYSLSCIYQFVKNYLLNLKFEMHDTPIYHNMHLGLVLNLALYTDTVYMQPDMP